MGKLTTGSIRQMHKLHEEGLKVSEIAEILGVSVATVYARLKDEKPIDVQPLDKTCLMTSSALLAMRQKQSQAEAAKAEAPEPSSAPVNEPEPVQAAPEPPRMKLTSVIYNGDFGLYEIMGSELIIRAGQSAALKLLKRDLPDLIRELEELRTALASISTLMEEDGQ